MPDPQEANSPTKDSMVESVQREMQRRKRMLTLFLFLACVPVLVAVGVFTLSPPPESAPLVDTKELEAKISTVEKLTANHQSELTEAVDRSRDASFLAGKAENIANKAMDNLTVEMRSFVNSMNERGEDLARMKFEQESIKGQLREERALGKGFRTQFIELERHLNERGRRDPGAGKILRFNARDRLFPPHFSAKIGGETLVGDLGIITRRGSYCGMVRVISVTDDVAKVVAMPETVGRLKIKPGDDVVFRAVIRD